MLLGFKTPFEKFHSTKKFYTPFYELWVKVQEIINKKKQWLACPLNEIDPDEVDSIIKMSVKQL